MYDLTKLRDEDKILTKNEWYIRKIKDKLRTKLGIVVKRENFGNRQYYPPEIVISMMGMMLENKRPLAVGRMGMVELNWLTEAEQKDDLGKVLFKRKYEKDEWYSSEKNRMQFVELTRKAYADIDILANWYSGYLEEDILINKYTKKDLISTRELVVSPFAQKKPWSKYLEGKKVLVISPFVDEIRKQYEIREKLFENNDVLPEFELKTYKAIWIQDYIKRNCCTYQDVYNKYLEDIFKIDFEIALISCSAPSFALAADIKREGKIGIQMGGGLQIFFGIKGKRWDEVPTTNHFYNEYWIRPNDSSKPSDAELLDNSCYW